jgi:serine/threonine-protein kinase ATR
VEGAFDFLNFHIYAEVEGYPTWRRSYPEDPKFDDVLRVNQLIEWRDRNAPGKDVRVTEFGWNASTKAAPSSVRSAKWTGLTEAEQAGYLVRSFLLFSKLDVSRVYIFFDEQDEPQVHGSSGLTRNERSKPAFDAVAKCSKGRLFFRNRTRSATSDRWAPLLRICE